MASIYDDVITRKRLPNRRISETFEFENAGLRFTCTFSRLPDGRAPNSF